MKTRTGRTGDGKVFGTLLPMLREPSVWLEVAAALGVGEPVQAKAESVETFLLRLEWQYPAARFALKALGESSEVVRHLSDSGNRPNWKTLFASVLRIVRIDWRGDEKKIATSENAAPLIRFVAAGRPVLYTEGYPNCAVLALMRCLSGQGLVAAHWGDADLDGLNIAALVQGNMPGSRIVAEEVIAVPGCVPGIPLTDAQRQRLARFLARNPACPYGDCLKMLLDRRCWYEQESFPLG